MKVLDKEKVFAENQVAHTRAERDALAKLRSPFIVRMFHAFQTERKLYLILEYVPGGELFTHLAKARRFNENRARLYIAELILAIEYLHSKGVIYRDLKPENILLRADGHLVLTDFGLIKTYDREEDEKTHTFCGTPVYFAPEVIADEDEYGSGYGKSCDLWTLGVLSYEMLVGRVPWKHANLDRLFEMIVNDPLPWVRSPVLRTHVLPLTPFCVCLSVSPSPLFIPSSTAHRRAGVRRGAVTHQRHAGEGGFGAARCERLCRPQGAPLLPRPRLVKGGTPALPRAVDAHRRVRRRHAECVHPVPEHVHGRRCVGESLSLLPQSLLAQQTNSAPSAVVGDKAARDEKSARHFSQFTFSACVLLLVSVFFLLF